MRAAQESIPKPVEGSNFQLIHQLFSFPSRGADAAAAGSLSERRSFEVSGHPEVAPSATQYTVDRLASQSKRRWGRKCPLCVCATLAHLRSDLQPLASYLIILEPVAHLAPKAQPGARHKAKLGWTTTRLGPLVSPMAYRLPMPTPGQPRCSFQLGATTPLAAANEAPSVSQPARGAGQ